MDDTLARKDDDSMYDTLTSLPDDSMDDIFGQLAWWLYGWHSCQQGWWLYVWHSCQLAWWLNEWHFCQQGRWLYVWGHCMISSSHRNLSCWWENQIFSNENFLHYIICFYRDKILIKKQLITSFQIMGNSIITVRIGSNVYLLTYFDMLCVIFLYSRFVHRICYLKTR